MAKIIAYEPDMHIIYDVLTSSVFVMFRDKTEVIGPFADRREAIKAAEEFCRKNGWSG